MALDAVIRNVTLQPPTVDATAFSWATSTSVFCNDFVRVMPWEVHDPTGMRERKSRHAVRNLPRERYSPFEPEDLFV